MVQSNRSSVYLGQCDEIKRNDRWLQTISTADGYYQTRSGQLWRGIKCRLGKKGYKDVRLGFKDFQDFAEWCHSQPEFYLDGYHLDKDILGDSTIYSRGSCCFIPYSLNVVMQGIGSFRKGEKVGASYFKRDDCWRAYCFVDGQQIHLGYHGTQEAAHNEWRKYKALTLRTKLGTMRPLIKKQVEKIILELEGIK